jgi:hypothetical protein
MCAPAALSRRSAAFVSARGRIQSGARSAAKRASSGFPSLGDVELDACATRRVLEPRVPERPRIREHAVEVESERQPRHETRC